MVFSREVLMLCLKFIPAHDRGGGSVSLAIYSERMEAIFNTLILFKQHFAYPKEKKKSSKYFAVFH